MKIPIILSLLALACTARARLGETYDQIVARYGEGSVVTKTNDDEFIAAFRHGEFFIGVTFWKGQSAAESVTRYVGGEPTIIFQEDGDKLFQDISGGGKAVPERSHSGSNYTNKATGATGSLRGSDLTVNGKKWLEHVVEKDKAKTSGF